MTHPRDAAAERWNQERWEPPIPLHQRVPLFPITTAFPPGAEIVRDYCVATAEAFQVPVDLPAALILTSAGLALSHKACVRLGDEWVQTPNQYMGVLLESANRKTGPYNEATGPILEWEGDEAARLAPIIAEQNASLDIMRRKAGRFKDLAAGKVAPRRKSDEPSGSEAEAAAVALERQIAEKKPVGPPQALASDITPEELAKVLAANGERIGIFSDESEVIEILLGRYSDQPNFQIFNKGYDGSGHRVNRVTSPPILLKKPLISVGLVIQPEGIRDLLQNRKARGTGLVARFGLSMPRSKLGHRKINPAGIPKDLRQAWRTTLRGLIEVDIRTPDGAFEVQLSAPAKSVFDDFCAHIEPSLEWCGEFAQFGMQDWGGKLCGRIGRIALVLHGLRYGSALTQPISKETVVAAMEWAPYLIEHTRAAMGWLGVDEDSVRAKRILAWIARTESDRFSKQGCFTGVRNTSIRTADEMDAPLQILCELRYLRKVPEPEIHGRGRPPSPEFVVNPTWDRRSL